MKIHHRKSFKLFLFLGALGVLFLVYWQVGLMPFGLKNKVIRKIEALTQKKVEFTKILYLPFQGVIFDQLRVSDKNGELIFSAKNFVVDLQLIPFFKEKKLVLRRVTLEAPVYDHILKLQSPAAAGPPRMTKISGQIPIPVIPENQNFIFPENVYLEQVHIANGRVNIRLTEKSPVVEEIRDIHLTARFTKPPVVRLDGSFLLGRNVYANVILNGNWNLETSGYDFNINLKSERVPGWLLDLQKNNVAILHDGHVTANLQLKSIDDNRILFQTKAGLKDGHLSLNVTQYRGQMSLAAKGVWDLEATRLERYRGELTLKDVDIQGLARQVPHLENIRGQVSFEPELLTFQNIRGRYGKLDFTSEGRIESFTERRLEAVIRSDAEARDIVELLPAPQKETLSKYDLTGNCKAEITVTGTLKEPVRLTASSSIAVQNGTVTSKDEKIRVTDISGNIQADDSGFKVQQGRFTAGDKKYALDAFLPKQPGDLGALELVSPDLSLSGNFTLLQNTILIRNAEGRYLGIPARFQGQLVDLKNPYLDIEGQADLELASLHPRIVEKAAWLKTAGLKGALSCIFVLKGLWNRPLDWQLDIDAQGNPVYFKDTIRLDNLFFQVRMKNRVLDIPYFQAGFYEGALGGKLLLDLTTPDTFFEGRTYANGVNLAWLIQDAPIKNKFLSGTAIFQLAMKGWVKQQESWVGAGAIDVRSGRLWETPLFKKMGDLLFVKVQGLDKVVFHNASANFDVHDKKIWTQNLVLYSDTVDLNVNGTIGFDGKLDLLMAIGFSQNVLAGALDAGGLVPLVVREAGDFISNYRISGTLKEPKYEKVGQATGQVIGKKISGLLQGLVSQ